jgi:transposase-like protein
MLSMDDLFKVRHFDREIIILCVRWYLRFKLSFRDLVEMMAERGISLSHTTIMRWIARYVPEFEKRWNRFACRVGTARTLLAECISGSSSNRPVRTKRAVAATISARPPKIRATPP